MGPLHRGGKRFESEVLIVTGASGTGKTEEINQLMDDFNASNSVLPGGQPAKVVHCVLDRKGGWKDLGRQTLEAMEFPLCSSARITQAEIWKQVAVQGRIQGIVGIQYDEVQHIMAGKSETALEEILDFFKTILKSRDWPLMLIFSGVPELRNYFPRSEQLFRKATHFTFDDIDYDTEAGVIAEILDSYALETGLSVDSDLYSRDFIHRLASAGAFRWGVVCEIIMKTVGEACAAKSAVLTREHFLNAWVTKTNMTEAVTPFNHPVYTSMFRKDKLFWKAIPD